MEIGSEFCNAPLCKAEKSNSNENKIFTLSGRTALELVARDLKEERGVKSIYMPAYCCEAMMAPFKKQGYTIKRYAVEPYSKTIHRQVFSDHGCDAILLMDYFGFECKETAVFAMAEQLRGTAVILDRVHTAFSDTEACNFADYTVTSWRKWFLSCAAEAEKKCGDWLVAQPTQTNERYISLRKKAAAIKDSFAETGENEAEHSAEFREAEELLDRDYSDYAPDDESIRELAAIDSEFIISHRRKNAALIYKELSKLPAELIRPLFAEIGERDVPLYVPVLVKPEIRANLRRHLMQNDVFCPIHWQMELGGANKLYDGELSLVCDQRYDEEDIKREMLLIAEFFENI